MPDLEKIKADLEPVAWRIERYLEETEVNTPGDDVFKNLTYVQQRAKLTAYLYFLQLLESDMPKRIDQRRGVKNIDEKAGIIVDTKPYLETLQGLSKEEKIQRVRKEMPVPEWDS
jgi:hypothetical protein